MLDKVLNKILAAFLLTSSMEACKPESRIEEIKPLSKDDSLLMNSSQIISCEK